MAITCNYQPTNFARVYDSNICSYQFTTTNYAQANFSYYAEFYCAGTKIASQKFYPTSTGVVFINPTSVYKNYMSPSNQIYDLNLGITGVTSCPNSLKSFQMILWESFGTPPTNYNVYSGNTIYFYNGNQQFIDYQSVAGGGNLQWVMNTGGTGNFLSDVNQIFLDEKDYYNLFFITNTGVTKIQYVWNVGGGGGGIAINGPQGSNEFEFQSITHGSPDAAYVPPYKPPVSGTTSGSTLTEYDVVNITQPGMYQIPIGMIGLRNKWSLPDNWGWYQISLWNGTTKLNGSDFTVYYTNRDCRYPNYQVYWLNKHGGYDGMVWDKGNVVKNKIVRDTYKKSLFPNYNFQQAGELVHNIQVEEDFTLTTSLLDAQSQSQLIMGMYQSPVIFVLNNILGTLFTVPYICLDDEVTYQQMLNDQSIYYQCTLRPSNQRIEQSF